MLQVYGLDISVSMIYHLLVSMGFVIGIILMVAPEAFDKINEALNKEYGLKYRIIPSIEDAKSEHIDKLARKYSVIVGMVISVVAFVLILIFK